MTIYCMQSIHVPMADLTVAFPIYKINSIIEEHNLDPKLPDVRQNGLSINIITHNVKMKRECMEET